MIHSSLVRRAIVLGLALLAACSNGSVDAPVTTTPTPTPGTSSFQVNALTPAAGAPAIANPVVTFYAKLGEDREASMYYKARAGGRDSTVFVRFRVSKRALLTRPNGVAFATGDSILITITLVDPAHLEVGFEPSGLRFSSSEPADLKLNFLETDNDYNHDGVVNGSDDAIQHLLSVWRRESASQPWIKQTSLLTVASHEIETDVTGFSGYIIAW